MARQVKVRESYLDETIKLRRLRESIKKDGRQSEEWRKNAIDRLNALIEQFLRAEGA